jgi:putative transposase
MPRPQRTDAGNYVYHVLNRANARVQIFDNEKDYKLFLDILEEAKEKFDMRILAYCIMPNHWHLVLYPKNDGDLSKFMGWLTNTHTRRWHTIKRTIGQGHLYQGRYKSFLCQDDAHFLTLVRYVERNAKKANLSRKAEDWKWGSAYIAKHGTVKQKKIISSWPVQKPKDYLSLLNNPQSEIEENLIEKSIKRSSPFGGDSWVKRIINKFNLGSTINSVGRPKKGG